MADWDVQNDTTPKNSLVTKTLPTIAALKAAIAGSGVAASYPTAVLLGSTENDLIYICKLHNISVVGL
jgi:hypothetical protein